MSGADPRAASAPGGGEPGELIEMAAELARLAGGIDDYDDDTGESGIGFVTAESLRRIASRLNARAAALRARPAGPPEPKRCKHGVVWGDDCSICDLAPDFRAAPAPAGAGARDEIGARRYFLWYDGQYGFYRILRHEPDGTLFVLPTGYDDRADAQAEVDSFNASWSRAAAAPPVAGEG